MLIDNLRPLRHRTRRRHMSGGEVPMAEQIKPNRPYPIQIKLRDGKTAAIRLMEPKDVDQIVEFAKTLPADDLLFLRTDITDRGVVKQWADAIKNGQTITLLAEVDGDLAAYASDLLVMTYDVSGFSDRIVA